MLIKVKLDKLLKEKRYTIQQVADGTGIHRNTISLIVNGKTDGISFDTLEKLCLFLKCKVEDILEYIQDNVA